MGAAGVQHGRRLCLVSDMNTESITRNQVPSSTTHTLDYHVNVANPHVSPPHVILRSHASHATR